MTFEYLHKSTSKRYRSTQECLWPENYKGTLGKSYSSCYKARERIPGNGSCNRQEPLVIHLSDNYDSGGSKEELVWRNQKNKNGSL